MPVIAAIQKNPASKAKFDTKKKLFFCAGILHLTSESGGKNTFKRYLKSEQKHRQTESHTDTHMEKSTYRKHWPRGPML